MRTISGNISRAGYRLLNTPPERRRKGIPYTSRIDIQMAFFLLGTFDRGLGTLDQLIDLCDYFGCTLDEILEGTEYEGEGRKLLPRSRVDCSEPAEENSRELEIIRLKAKLFELLYAKEVLP